MEEYFDFEGTVENIIYKNTENAYSVFSILCEEEELVCVGNVLELHEGESIRLRGLFVVHPIYGRQLSVKSYEKLMPSTEQGMERYLGSGVIKGVGPRLAKRIVDMFGLDTFHIIENEPVRLAQIKGITKEKALSIAEIYMKQLGLKNILMYLQDLGISAAYAIKIYKEYGEGSIDIIKSNPYKIADDIFGIGFKTSDMIAERVGVSKDSIYRLKSGIRYTLNKFSLNGHTFMPLELLERDCSSLLEVSVPSLKEALTELQLESHIVQKVHENNTIVYLSKYFFAERACAQKLAIIARDKKDDNSLDIDRELRLFEKENKISLAEKQKQALREAVESNILVITGGPGTGKTTIINTLISLFKKEGKEVILAAPTGRAAKRMTEATGQNAQTIHRLLEMSFLSEDSGLQKFLKNEEDPLEADVIIIDETSMVDILLLSSLLKAVPQGTKLIFVGDADQLPSVGAGNVLSDIINSGCVKVVLLDEIFRQAQKSAIILNAHRINKGENPVFNEEGSDFFFLRRETAGGVVNALLELLTKRLEKFIRVDRLKAIQVLSPMRKGTLGVSELNRLLQETLNPPSVSKKERELRMNVFREGDKVMQIRNNYKISWYTEFSEGGISDAGAGVFNGDQGYIRKIHEEKEEITVAFDDGKIVVYDFSQIDELELAYATTIHKSQGSEYPVVILPLLNGHSLLMTRNLLYTAVTRAKRLVVIVGAEERIRQMVANNMEVKRYSALREQIIRAFSLI